MLIEPGDADDAGTVGVTTVGVDALIAWRVGADSLFGPVAGVVVAWEREGRILTTKAPDLFCPWTRPVGVGVMR